MSTFTPLAQGGTVAMSQACSKCGEQESLASHAIHECTMKAFHCTHIRHPFDGSLLVFAESHSKAKSLAAHSGPYDWEFVEVSACRAKEWDGLFDKPRIVEDNDDLPAGAPAFYTNDIH